MTNAINSNYFLQYQKNAGQLSKYAATQSKAASPTASPVATDEDTNLLAGYLADAKIEISDAGLQALNKAQTEQSDEEKLSDKAKNYLATLREKYGDYDFVISNDLDTSKTVDSEKPYSVILTAEEIERMAEDDDYAEKVMGQVGDAVDTLKKLSEKDLGEGVQFSQLSITFDSEGNQKLFAQLEKLTDDQKERLEEAKEKRAERQKEAEQKTKNDEESEEDGMPITFKSADVEADNAEELLKKIFEIDWTKIPAEVTYI